LALIAPWALHAQDAPTAPGDEIIELDAFVVNALTDERNRSIEAKRASDSIGDFIAADRLGQFVDADIGAVVERLPGVYTSGAGQSGGSGISIRGLGGGFNSLQLDGDRLPSNQGGTRGVSIDNIPAELIGAIEIFKAPTPEREADSIGGVVNVETKSGLDLDRRLINARALYGWDEYGTGSQYRTSFTYSDRLGDDVGIFLSLTRAENDRRRDEIRSDPADFVFDQLVTTNPALPRITGPDATRVFLPSRVDYRRTEQSQQNTGANLNLDWRVSEDFRLSFRTFYARFDEQRPQIRNLWRFDRSTGNDPNNRTFPHPDYVYFDQPNGTFYFGEEQRIVRRIADQDETEDVLRLQIEGVHRWHDATLDYALSRGESSREFWNSTYIFTTDDVQLVADVDDLRSPSFSVVNPGEFFYNTNNNPRVPNLFDPLSYRNGGDGFFERDNRRAEVIDAEDEITTFALNYRKMFDDGLAVKIGGKFRTQSKVNQRDFVIGPSGFSFDATQADFQGVNGYFDGRQDLGTFPTHASLQAQNQGDAREFVAAVLGLPTPPADSRRDSTIQDLAADEDVLGLYAQASKSWDRFTLLGGVRWERTSSDYRGFTADVTGNPVIDATRAVAGSRTYDDFYPSIHLSYRLADRLLLRSAIGVTLARPEFEDLTPSSYATLSTDSDTGRNIVNLQRGNADLDPTQSTNFDLSLEYYFEDGGLFSIAAFHKELRNWIYESTFIAPPSDFPEYAAVPDLEQVRVSSTLNGDDASVTGIELNLERDLAWGFSFGANYTQLSFDVNAAQTGLDRVPGQSDRLVRVSLNYESDKFLARLSLRDSGSIVDDVVTFSSPAAIAYFQSQGMGELITREDGSQIIGLGLYDVEGPQLDLVAEYRLTSWARAFVQANNLLRENSAAYLDERETFAEKWEYRSWSTQVGVKLAF
jgi:TonB-dependent receptor